ncbi:hypothetical protein [Streptomyces sp. NRRL S-1314]|uniref:hypothetical protein n=1 Tax=Streptomyces TaxID=1883 RepID=UPI0004CB9661|nr:hypothetical protein [Streptomyces sp. NRRL S-1314]
MIAPTKRDRAGALPTLRTGSRVLFLALVCLLAALPAAALALTSGAAATHPHPGTLPRADVLGLLCRQDAQGAAEAAGITGGAPRPVPTPSSPRTPPHPALAAPTPARLTAEPCTGACGFAVLGVRRGARPAPGR